MPAAVPLIAAGIGAAGSMYASSQQADAQRSAADTAAGAQLGNAQTSYQQWLQDQANQQPWLRAGRNSINQLAYLLGTYTPDGGDSNPLMSAGDAYLLANPDVMNAYASAAQEYGINSPQEWAQYHYQNWGKNDGRTWPSGGGNAFTPTGEAGSLMQPFTPEDFLAGKDPGYDWRKQEGVNALAASGAAAGNYGSGNMGVALQNYGQNLASQEYQSAWDRWNQQQMNEYNMLAGVARTGQIGAQNLGAQGAQVANNLGNYNTNAANAFGAGQIGAANAWASGFGNLANQGIGALDRYRQDQSNNNLWDDPANQGISGSEADLSWGTSPGAHYSRAHY